MCWKRKKVSEAVVERKKILVCSSCGKELENNSLDAQLKHQAETGHRLYSEEFVSMPRFSS